MRNILDELYEGYYEPRFSPSEEYRRRSKADEGLWEKVQEAYGARFVDELCSGINALSVEEERSMFRHGFHLGALLMLDLLYEPPQSV